MFDTEVIGWHITVGCLLCFMCSTGIFKFDLVLINLAKAFVGLTIFFSLLAVYFYFIKFRTTSSSNQLSIEEDIKMALARECFMITPSAKATASVIFLHGLGDNGSGWSHGFDEQKKSHIRYIFPNAPARPVTLNGGFVMPAWFDLKALDPNSEEDEAGIKASAEKIRQLIEKETTEHGIPSNRIVLGGFSMGGALALYTGLTHPEPLGGVIALSSWLPLHKSFRSGAGGLNLKNQRCPIFQGHGEADPMVNPMFGKITHELLKSERASLGTQTELKLYPGVAHSSCDEEMDDVKTFIEKTISGI